jgi:hypothetical protein
MMPLDSAWRQWKGATRDLARALDKVDQSCNVWQRTLFDQFVERVEEAKEAGMDVTSDKVLLTLGVPCVSCLTIVTKLRGTDHKLYLGGKDSPVAYCECPGDHVDPDKADMPVWPAMPKPAAEQ